MRMVIWLDLTDLDLSLYLIEYYTSPRNLIKDWWYFHKEGLWETVINVIPIFFAWLYNFPSTSIDRALVHSSNIAYLGAWKNNLAIAIFCFSPPDRTSFQSRTVSSPFAANRVLSVDKSTASKMTLTSSSYIWFTSSVFPFFLKVSIDIG